MSGQEAGPRGLRVLLQPRVTQADVESLALDAGWVPLGSHPATETRPYASAWKVENAGVQVDFVWDDLVRVAYLYLQGDRADGVAVDVRTALPTWALDDVLALLRSSDDRDVRLDAVLRLGVTRAEQSDEALTLLLGTADDDDPWIRRAFVTAAGYLLWPPLVDRARSMRTTDPNPQVRDEADIVVEAIDAGEN